jgi:hypothetical protein
MVLFPAYAVLVWYFAFRWRRTWIGWASVLVGVGAVGLIAVLHRTINGLLAGALDGPMFPMMLAAEAGFVFLVGAFIVMLPIDAPDLPCRRCHYDLSGLEAENPTCPECGMPHAAIKVKKRHCRVCNAEFFVTRQENPPCPKCGVDHAVKAIRPPRPRVLVPMMQNLIRPIYPRISRNNAPNSKTAKGIPTIIVVRRPDNTFSSIG